MWNLKYNFSPDINISSFLIFSASFSGFCNFVKFNVDSCTLFSPNIIHKLRLDINNND